MMRAFLPLCRPRRQHGWCVRAVPIDLTSVCGGVAPIHADTVKLR